jgi:hypothetical protein
MIWLMAKGSIIMLMGPSTKDNGTRMNSMVREKNVGQMVLNIAEHTSAGANTAKVN